MKKRFLPWVILAVALQAGGDVGGASQGRCDLSGPLSDFWPKVIRDWSRRIPGLNHGATQTAAWVSLVYGDPGEGSDSRKSERFIRRWSAVQEWNWVRSEIWKRPYSRVAEGLPEERLGFRQNLILTGTPASNPLLSRVLGRVGIRIHLDSLEIGGRGYSGADLLLVAILPSPFVSGKYVLCVVGMSDDALRGLGSVAFGHTDYALFRGRKLLEGGSFEKPFCEAWKPAKHPDIIPQHAGWVTEETGTLRYHFDPTRTTRESVRDLAAAENATVEAANRFLRFPRNEERIESYLYASADEKFRETGDGSPAHLDESSSALHRVMVPGSPPDAYLLAYLLIRRNLGGSGAPGLRLALALAASSDFEGRPLEEYALRQSGTAGTLNLAAVAELETPPSGEGLLGVIGAASFVRFLVEEGHVAEVKQFYLNSRAGSLSSHFRELLGESPDQAEERWRSSLARAGRLRNIPGAGRSEGGAPDSSPLETRPLLEEARRLFLDRKDDAARKALGDLLRASPRLAEAHLLLARIAFRGGELEAAVAEARRALLLAGEEGDLAAWAHVTLGRAEALLGHYSAAAMELRAPSLARGPEAPGRLADLWLENLGQSPNRKAVEEQLKAEARADLQNFDWDSAEKKLKSILTANPDDPRAHFALSEVYQRHHDYWVERATLGNELHPGTTPLDPSLYHHLADRAAREMEEGMILSLPELAKARAGRVFGKAGSDSPLEALDLFDPSLRQRGDSPDQRHHHFFLGRAYFFSAEWERARQELRLSLGQDGADQRIVAWDFLYLGYIDLFQGRRESACAYFEAARKLKIGGRVSAAARKGLSLSSSPGH